MTEVRYYYLVTPLAYTGAAAAFTYHAATEIPLGQIVQIPLGTRKLLGVITGVSAQPEFKTRAITTSLDLPPVPQYLQDLAAWMSDYYASSPAAVWSTLLPAGLSKTRRDIKARSQKPAAGLPDSPLTADQAATLAAIRASQQRIHLIQGVTGSGKTRLYLELAAEALAAGRSAIILVPEITLTPQVVAQFETAFGPLVLATHSKLTEAQRDKTWRAALAAHTAGEPRVVVGPRSSLFLPVHNPGLIVIDECHESSYKQEQHPRYHAISTAAKLGSLTDAKVVLGSATPGLPELFLSHQNRVSYHIITQRVADKPLPEAEIIDLRNKDFQRLSKFITQPLFDAVSRTFAEGRQSLLYINRRGSASSQVCGDCGHVTVCPDCQLPLTFHEDLMRLICHHCNYRQASLAICPECNAANLRLLGGGTKRIEAEVARLWPGARVARLDRDSANLRHIEATYAGLRSGDIDIVIGTQMIAKGLDLPAIDTVGVISADTMLQLPDFAAAERTFQLLTQVAGRAGRGDRPGRVYIQTYSPDHPVILAAARHDYSTFAHTELEQRRLHRYPPFIYLLQLTVTAKTQAAAMTEADSFATALRKHAALEVVGPAPAFLETLAGAYRWVLTVKSTRRPLLVQIARQLPGDHWTADLDPSDLL